MYSVHTQIQPCHFMVTSHLRRRRRVYILTLWSRVLLEKLTGFQLVKNSHFMETEGSLPHSQVPTTGPYPETAQPSPYPHIILTEDPSYYYPPIYSWVSQAVSFPLVSPPKLYTPLFSPIRSTYPAHLIFDFVTRAILAEGYRSLSSSLCNFLQYLVTSSLFGPNILLNTLFSNTLSLRSTHSVSDKVSHPYKTTDGFIYC